VAALLAVFVPGGAFAQGAPPAGETEEPESREPVDPETGEEPAPDEEAAPSEEPKRPEPLPGDQLDEEEPEPPLIPPAADTLAGHVDVTGSIAFAVPFGQLEEGVDQTSVIGSGHGVGLDIGIGVSRTVAIGAWGQALALGDSDDCIDCSGASLAFGGFVRYHLVQGVRFDPWMSAGLGYRTTTFSGVPGGDVDYSGIEWLRLQVGGDWYPFSHVGLGPFMELDMGIYGDKSVGSIGESAAHWLFQTGLRITLDIPGRR
jgi:hypothetical protein